MTFFRNMVTLYSKNIVLNVSIISSNWIFINFDIYSMCQKATKVIILHALKIKNKNKLIELSILLSDDKRLFFLNKMFRNSSNATNVLSFPFYKIKNFFVKDFICRGNHVFLGDIAVSFERIFNESLEQKKSFKEYFIYAFIHGFLHLLGYNHIASEDANIMRYLEIKIIEQIAF